MAVARKAGKALYFIDDRGNQYSTSITYLDRLTAGKIKAGFLVLSRLPRKAGVDRFPPSPLWNPEGVRDEGEDELKTTKNDGYSKVGKEEVAATKLFTDKEVQW